MGSQTQVIKLLKGKSEFYPSPYCVSQKSYHSPWYTVRDQHILKRAGVGLKKRDTSSVETGRRKKRKSIYIFLVFFVFFFFIFTNFWPWYSFLFYSILFIHSFIHLFIYGCVGSSFLWEGFLQLWQVGPLFMAVRGPLTIAASPVAEHRLQSRRLSSCGSRAQLLCGMWDLPRPGLEPVSPALAGRFSTTAPPGKPEEKY